MNNAEFFNLDETLDKAQVLMKNPVIEFDEENKMKNSYVRQRR